MVSNVTILSGFKIGYEIFVAHCKNLTWFQISLLSNYIAIEVSELDINVARS